MVQNPSTRPAPDIRKLFFYIVQIIVVGLLVWYLYQNRDLFVLLRNVRWQHIFWIVVFDTASYFVISYTNYSIITRLDPKISYIDSLMLQYINSMLNKIVPTIGAGAAFRAYFLKKKYQFSYTQFASSVTVFYVVSFFTTSLIGILCLLLIYLQYQVFNWVIFLVFLGILLPALVVILFPLKVPTSNHRLLRILKNAVDSWNTIKKQPKYVFIYVVSTVLLLVLSSAYTFLGYSALGVSPSPIQMLYLSTLGIIIILLNFTPDGIGIKEGLYVFSQKLVQIPQDVLILGSLYLRAVSMVTTVAIGALSYWILSRQLKGGEGNPIPFAEND